MDESALIDATSTPINEQISRFKAHTTRLSSQTPTNHLFIYEVCWGALRKQGQCFQRTDA